MKISPIALIVVIGMLLWLLVNPIDRYFNSVDVEPRAVTARGDLAADEQNTIDIFRNNSPSVVYVTSIALRRGFFPSTLLKFRKVQVPVLYGIPREG